MDKVVFKCFRCDLTFKDNRLAEIHKEIMNHPITRVHVQTISS